MTIDIARILELHLKWLKDEKQGKKANLSGVNLYRAYLSGANLCGADLSEADLSRANLYGANLSGANLCGANLSEASLSGADLSEASLSGADLSGADLSEAKLYGANLSGADLSEADLSEAKLYGANLSHNKIVGFYLGKHFGFYFEGNVKIGCHFLSLKEWIKSYKKIGKKEGYTKDEIALYGAQLKLIAKHFKKGK